MVTWAEVQTWQRGPLDDAVQAAHDRRSTLERVADDLTTRRGALDAQGQTADAVRAALDRESDVADDLVAQFSELVLASAEASDGVWEIETAVHECITYAEIQGLVISSTGAVSIAAWKQADIELDNAGGGYGRVQSIAQSALLELESAISNVLTSADTVDSNYKTRLDALSTVDSTEGSGSFSQGLPDRPNPDWSATEVAAWWNALTDEERALIIANDPDAIGNLNGIDAHSRDLANRNRLAGLIEAAEAEVAAELAELIESEGANSSSYLDAVNRLSDLRQTQESLENWPGTSLLLLDATSGDQVRAAVAIGDVDNAAHVGTYVPGMTTNVRDSLDGSINDVNNLRQNAIDRSGLPPSDVAMIAWLGYDAPPGAIEAAGTSRAEEGAGLLSGFLEGIQASHTASGSGDSHMSVFGHSYGSTTSGMMTTEVNVGVVDDLVMFGSPGSGAQDIRDYNIDSGGAYVSAVDSYDAVQGIGPDGSFGVNPTKLDGVEHLSNDTPPWSGQWWNPFARHSDYLKLNPDGTPTGTLDDFADVLTDRK